MTEGIWGDQWIRKKNLSKFQHYNKPEKSVRSSISASLEEVNAWSKSNAA